MQDTVFSLILGRLSDLRGFARSISGYALYELRAKNPLKYYILHIKSKIKGG